MDKKRHIHTYLHDFYNVGGIKIFLSESEKQAKGVSKCRLKTI